MNKIYIYYLVLPFLLNGTESSASHEDTEEEPLLAEKSLRNRKHPQPFGTPSQRTDKSTKQTKISTVSPQSVPDRDFEKIKKTYSARNIVYDQTRIEESLHLLLSLDEQKFINTTMRVHRIDRETARSLYQKLKIKN